MPQTLVLKNREDRSRAKIDSQVKNIFGGENGHHPAMLNFPKLALSQQRKPLWSCAHTYDIRWVSMQRRLDGDEAVFQQNIYFGVAVLEDLKIRRIDHFCDTVGRERLRCSFQALQCRETLIIQTPEFWRENFCAAPMIAVGYAKIQPEAQNLRSTGWLQIPALQTAYSQVL